MADVQKNLDFNICPHCDGNLIYLYTAVGVVNLNHCANIITTDNIDIYQCTKCKLITPYYHNGFGTRSI